MLFYYSPAPDFFICSKKVFLPGEEHVTRICERSVLILMLEGVLRFREDGEFVELHAGEYYIQRQRLLQEGVPIEEPPVYYYIEFVGSFGEGGQGIPLRGVYDAKSTLPIMERICRAVADKSCNGFLISSYMNRVFGELMGGGGEHGNTARLIKAYIESGYSSDVTMKELSRRFGYTEDYVNRLFKKEFGITPHKHLINVRLEHALWLLENTDLSEEKIALSVGYGDFSAFWRAFKQKYGSTPGKLRGRG